MTQDEFDSKINQVAREIADKAGSSALKELWATFMEGMANGYCKRVKIDNTLYEIYADVLEA